MVDKTLSQVRTDNAAVAPIGTEPIESVQSATSAAFIFAELSNHPIDAQTGTTYTLAITDQGKAVTMNNASANTCTIPLNATVAFHIGTLLIVRQIGAGLTTLAATGGVTIEKASGTSLTMAGAQEQLVLHKTATDTWHVAPMNPAVGGGGVSGCRLTRTTDLTIDGNTLSEFTVEDYDDDGFADIGTNNDRFTIPSGVTRVNIMYRATLADVAADSDVSMTLDHLDSGLATIDVFTVVSLKTDTTTPSINYCYMGLSVSATDVIRSRFITADTSCKATSIEMVIQDVSP